MGFNPVQSRPNLFTGNEPAAKKGAVFIITYSIYKRSDSRSGHFLMMISVIKDKRQSEILSHLPPGRAGQLQYGQGHTGTAEKRYASIICPYKVFIIIIYTVSL